MHFDLISVTVVRLYRHSQIRRLRFHGFESFVEVECVPPMHIPSPASSKCDVAGLQDFADPQERWLDRRTDTVSSQEHMKSTEGHKDLPRTR